MADHMDEKEAEVYDRQIRLWGVEAQKRMSGSKILFCGMSGSVAEACKNIVLAGISVTLQDDAHVRLQDLGANFFLRPDDVYDPDLFSKKISKGQIAASAQPRVAELNKLATVTTIQGDVADVKDQTLAQYNCVCLSGCSLQQQVRVNKVCRQQGIAFYVVESFGMHGYIFCDLLKHTFRKEVGDAMSDPVHQQYASLEEALAVQWSDLKNRWGPVPKVYVQALLIQMYEDKFGEPLRPAVVANFAMFAAATLKSKGLAEDFLTSAELSTVCHTAHTEFSPVCAILGGILGQEILKFISQKGEPANNVFVFDGTTSEGQVVRVPRG